MFEERYNDMFGRLGTGHTEIAIIALVVLLVLCVVIGAFRKGKDKHL